MNPIQVLREALEQRIDEHGDKSVPTSKIVELLEKFEERPEVQELLRNTAAGVDSASLQMDDSDRSRYKAELDDWLGQREHSRQWDLENFRQTLALGQTALRNAALINGGAAVALLAFAGNLLQHGGDATPFAMTMGVFGVGVFVSVLAMATTYISQLSYSGEDRWQLVVGKLFHVGTGVLALLAMLIFVGGVKMGYENIRDYVAPDIQASGSDELKKNMPPPKKPPADPPKPSSQTPPVNPDPPPPKDTQK